MLDFRIHTFITVCRRMNYTKAAADLNITQPTVTQHIQFLEQSYGTKLFQYQNRKLGLTEAGEELLRASLTVSSDETLLKERIRSLSDERSSLSFGATLTIGEFLFPTKLERLIASHPELNLQMTVENTQVLLTMIDKGEIEFAAVEGYFPKAEYDSQTFAKVPFIAVCKAGLSLAGQPSAGLTAAGFPTDYLPGKIPPVKLETLLGERLLIREKGSGTRNILERHLADRNLSVNDFKRTTEINNFPVLKHLTKAGSGITFVYRTAVEKELENGILQQIEIEDFEVSHNFTFVWRKGSIYRNEYLEFLKELL